MRVLGLDYGSARCGCALSDPTATVVTPLAPVLRPATKRGMAAIAALVAEHGVERVIVGLPLSLSGSDSAQTRETRDFAARLARRLGRAVAVELFDERFTTRLAQRHPGTAAEDSRAAAHLLADWLAAHARAGESGGRCRGPGAGEASGPGSLG